MHTAYPDGTIDVEREQKLVESHGNLVFQFPILWSNCPYMLKKWLDDVLTREWAYGLDSVGKLAGRKVALAVTAVIKEDYSEKAPYFCTLQQLLAPFEIAFRCIDADYRSFFALYGAEHELSADIVEQSSKCYIDFLNQL